MSTNISWEDTWAIFKSNPDALDDEFWRDMPDFLQGKSTKVQLDILRGCPRENIKSLMWCLTMDAQIMLVE